MSSVIIWEGQYFLICMMWGMALSLAYDFIRIFRRVWIHRRTMFTAAEDIVFWIISGFVIFHVMYLENDGIIRSFAVLGLALGAVLYHFATAGWLVENVAKPLKFLVKYIKIVSGYIKGRIAWYEKVRDKAGEAEKNQEAEDI